MKEATFAVASLCSAEGICSIGRPANSSGFARPTGLVGVTFFTCLTGPAHLGRNAALHTPAPSTAGALDAPSYAFYKNSSGRSMPQLRVDRNIVQCLWVHRWKIGIFEW